MDDYYTRYPYTKDVLEPWKNTQKGVYYIGAPSSTGDVIPYYVGKGCGKDGIRDRLIAHLGRWSDVTYFSYRVGTNDDDISNFELAEIKRLKPKYNVLGV